jgi:hypothetical protein
MSQRRHVAKQGASQVSWQRQVHAAAVTSRHVQTANALLPSIRLMTVGFLTVKASSL